MYPKWNKKWNCEENGFTGPDTHGIKDSKQYGIT